MTEKAVVFCYGWRKVTPTCAFRSRAPCSVRTFLGIAAATDRPALNFTKVRIFWYICIVFTDNRLKIFIALTESGSFTAASRRLGISQPAVSKCIAGLESDAGVPLLARRVSGFSLTPAGERFLLYSRRILALYESLSSELSAASGSVPDTPAPPAEQASLDLGDGRTALVSVIDGKLQIDLP